MSEIIIEFSDRDTAPERIEMLARECGISKQQLVKRFIAEGLGGYGLRKVDPDEEFTDLYGMLELSGALKPRNE